MTFVGWDGIGYRTGLAVSDDLKIWKKRGMIIDRGPAGSVTANNIALTSILRDNELHGSAELKRINGCYVGTYHAYPSAGYEVGPGVIGLCYSDDLENWDVRDPVLAPGDDGSWDAGGLYKSWLMEHDSVFYLFYNAKNRGLQPWIEKTGFATSTDLSTWKKSPSNPVLSVGEAGSFDDLFASDPCILRHKGQWAMFYFGNSSDGHARDGVAFSDDLLRWAKSSNILIDVGQTGSFDDKYAHKPAIISKDGNLYHFYCAVTQFSKRPISEIHHTEIRGITLAASIPFQHDTQ